MNRSSFGAGVNAFYDDDRLVLYISLFLFLSVHISCDCVYETVCAQVFVIVFVAT